MTGFDEWRAARDTGGPRTINFAGCDWEIPADMPWALADFIGSPTRTYRHMAVAIGAVFGDQTDKLSALGLDEVEIAYLLDVDLPDAYKTPAGDVAPKSGGSTPRRKRTGTP